MVVESKYRRSDASINKAVIQADAQVRTTLTLFDHALRPEGDEPDAMLTDRGLWRREIVRAFESTSKRTTTPTDLPAITWIGDSEELADEFRETLRLGKFRLSTSGVVCTILRLPGQEEQTPDGNLRLAVGAAEIASILVSIDSGVLR